MQDPADNTKLPPAAPATTELLPERHSPLGKREPSAESRVEKLRAEPEAEYVDPDDLGKVGGRVGLPRTNGQLRDYQKHTIARAAISGMPTPEIAALVRHTPKFTLDKIQNDAEIRLLMDHYGNQVQRAVVNHRFEMMERLDKCYAAIDAGLGAADLKLRLDSAKFVLSQITAGPAAQLNIGFGQTQATVDPIEQEVVRAAIKEIGSHIKDVVVAASKTVGYREHLVATKDLPGPGDILGLDRDTTTDKPEIKFNN